MNENGEIKITIKKQCFTDEEFAKGEMQNAIYQIAAIYFEQIGEHSGFLYGNGHHAAQAIAKHAKEDWERRSKAKKE